MEYVEGQTLKEKLIEESLTLGQSLQIAEQVTNALEIAHKKNIIHRDLKPANIMLTEQGHTMGAILYDEPPPLSEYLPEANPFLQESLTQMLAKDPDDRIGSASELAESLRRVLSV
jgi:serine/threonine protein kinase